jgi:uncharacterized protein DUF6542
VSTVASHHRTLWEEGRRPGRLVAVAAGALVLLVVLVDRATFGGLTLFFDIAFVLVCAGAALSVRPREFFVIGVYPPLLMAGTFAVLSAVSRDSLGDPADGFLQAVVSGLAHHAGALVAGYALTLVVLALRQVALRHHGTIRAGRSRG